MIKPIEVSVIIPVGDRTDNLLDLHSNYRRGLDACGVTYEVIYVIDGVRLSEREQLMALRKRGERLKIIQLSKAFGEATALMVAFANAVGATMLTLPAYFQIEGSEIATVLAAGAKTDLVVVRRWPRRGNGFESWRRAAFHALLKLIIGVGFRDLGCGVRVLSRSVAEELSIYGDQHRLLPVLAARHGFSVLEIDVAQSPRDRFRGRYRLREYLHRALDVFTVFFLARFTKKPLRFFGMIGSLMFGVGAVVIAVLVLQRLIFDQALADRPALLLGSLLLVLGVQLFALGLLGELIIFSHAKDLKDYKVAHIIEAIDTARREPAPVQQAELNESYKNALST
jgi:glycosyltransferase involved in cell wall biosynthesis